MTIYKHYEGYSEALEAAKKQTIEDDLISIDSLFGRDDIEDEENPEEVKKELLRQMEIDWRECVNETSTFWVNVANAGL
jgi:hypothetical protein